MTCTQFQWPQEIKWKRSEGNLEIVADSVPPWCILVFYGAFIFQKINVSLKKMVMVHENEEHVILQYLSDCGSIKRTVECYNIKAGNLSRNLHITAYTVAMPKHKI